MSDPANLHILINQINYDPEMAKHIGVEREFFLYTTETYGEPDYPEWMGIGYKTRQVFHPNSGMFLSRINDPAWTYELSACQVEHRSTPTRNMRTLATELREAQCQGELLAARLGLALSSQDLASMRMPLDVYPNERYQRISSQLSEDVLRAACMVAGTHIHVGACNLKNALWIYNRLVPHLNELCALGDHSDGERLRIYKKMAPNWQPPIYEGPEHFLRVSQEQGFTEQLRDCWHLIRISKHGTVELRMFGGTNDPEEIIFWVGHVRRLLGLRHT